jgi:translation initiation factor 3 subunit M
MASYTTLVNVDADSAIKLSSLISQILPTEDVETFMNECQNLIDSQKTQAFIEKILTKKDFILSEDNNNDIEGTFQAIVSIMFTLGEGVNTDEIIKQMIDVLTSNSSVNTQVARLRSLVSIFNLISSSQSKYDVFTGIIKYSIATKQTNAISHYHSRVQDWIESWDLTTNDKRSLFLNVAEMLAQDEQLSHALNYRIRYLETFSGESFGNDALPIAIDTVVRAIKSPIAVFGDRNAILECISARQTTGTFGSLVELLRIICTGTLESYDKYALTNSTLLKQHGIDPSEVSNSMRLLTLCSLAAENSSLTYELIAQTLKVDIEEVEVWIIESISQGLLDANMDQSKAVLTVSRCVYRSFGLNQWIGIQSQLQSLRKNFGSILETVKKHGMNA